MAHGSAEQAERRMERTRRRLEHERNRARKREIRLAAAIGGRDAAYAAVLAKRAELEAMQRGE